MPTAAIALRDTGPGVPLADRHLHPDRVARLTEALLSALASWHQAHPLADGAPRRDLHGAALAHLPSAVFDALVARLASEGTVALEGPRLRAASFSVALSDEQQRIWDQLVAELDRLGPTAPKFTDTLTRAPDLVALMLSRRILVRYGDLVTTANVLGQVSGQVRAYLEEHGRMLPTDFKAMFGLSRKHAIPLLEWLDGSKLTVRDGDARILRG